MSHVCVSYNDVSLLCISVSHVSPCVSPQMSMYEESPILLFFLVKFLETHLSLNFGTNLGLFGRSKAVEMVGGLMMRGVSQKDVLLGLWMVTEKIVRLFYEN